jgi:hypothetical protein
MTSGGRRTYPSEQNSNEVGSFGNYLLGGNPAYGRWPPPQLGKTRH